MASKNGLSILVLAGFLCACEEGVPPPAREAPPADQAAADQVPENGTDVVLVWTRGGRVLLRRPPDPQE